jgi:hypothetical protein
MSASGKLSTLRQLLAERFPLVPVTAGTEAFGDTPATPVLRTGVGAVDNAGGLPLSAITEVVCAAPSCGSHLLLGQLLATTRARQVRVALVDGADSFDPASFGDDLLAHLLWVRCHGTAEALQVVDLVARDANLGLVVLDLRLAPAIELRRIPATQWYRLQRAVESTDAALLVMTAHAAVPSARVRLQLEVSHSAAILDQERQELVAQLAPVRQRQRLAAAG